MRLLTELDPLDPACGLATDEALLESLRSKGHETIRFWIDRPAAVVGRSQCVADEVDLDFAARSDIPVLRRISGGGTVYHYPGNLNLSVVLKKRPAFASVNDAYDFFGGAIGAALSAWTTVEPSGNTLWRADRKIGGGAQARRGDTVLYHTTLLLEPAEIEMERILFAGRPGYAPHRVASRPAPTTTLADAIGRRIDARDVVTAILRQLEKRLGCTAEPGTLSAAERRRVDELVESKYGTDTWNRLH